MFTIGTHGELEEKFPALILGWCSISRFNGLVRFNHGQSQRDFYFFKGKIISTYSSQPSEGAVACLVRTKNLTNDNYRDIFQESQITEALPEQIAKNRFGVMGGQLRDAQNMSSRLLIKQMALDFSAGQYLCQNGTKPPAGSVMIELDPLYDIISALCDSLDEDKAVSWLREHNLFLRCRPASWGVIRPMLSAVAPRLRKAPDFPASEFAPGQASELIDILGISGRALLVLLALSAVTPSEPQDGDQELERPATPEVQAIRNQIKEEYNRIKDLDFFALFGLAEDAKDEAIRNAYLQMAQEWHSDHFGDADLGTAAKALQAINAKINEAKETLLDEKKKETYLFVLDRTRKGLPTDVEVILKAEDNYKKAELCIEQSKFQMALPLLEEAVQLNKGEGDFWIALALCQVAVRGNEAYEQAMANLKTAVEIDKNFEKKALVTQGRIELLLEKYKEAATIFDKVLENDPNNEIAKKSQHLITNRLSRQAAKESDKPKSIKELLLGK